MSDFLSLVDPLSGSFATLVLLPKRLLAISRSLSGDQGQISNSYQVVGGGSELEDPTHQRQPPVAGLTQQSHSLQPAEDFFYSFALTLTNFITRVARGPLINRALARSEEHTSELQSHLNLVCRLLLEKKNDDLGVTLPYLMQMIHTLVVLEE